MNRLIFWMQGYLAVELSGYSPERLLNLCSYNRIELWDLVCIGGKYRFFVRASDFKQMVGFVRKSKSRLVILEKRGLPFFLRRHRGRGLFAMGILVCAALLYLMSLRIWTIDFDGNSRFTDELLMETLREAGYETGMKKSGIVCDSLELMLRETYPEITWVSAQIKGTRLIVQLRENTGVLTAEPVDETPCDLVASRDGVITEIITRSGTPLVKAGDTVTAGQVLVSGVVELFNDSGEKTGEHSVKADATVKAATTAVYEERFSLEHSVKWYTGGERYQLTLWILGRKLFLDGNIRGFDTYDTVSEQGQLSLGGDFYLPVSWQWTTLREYEEQTAIYSEAEARSLAESALERYEQNLLEKGVQIIEKNVRIDMMGGECITQGTFSLIEEIAEEAPVAQTTGDQEE